MLLRLLETFDGALFITSNRAASFDPAVCRNPEINARDPLLVLGVSVRNRMCHLGVHFAHQVLEIRAGGSTVCTQSMAACT